MPVWLGGGDRLGVAPDHRRPGLFRPSGADDYCRLVFFSSYSWHTILYQFQMYNIVIRQLYNLQNDHLGKYCRLFNWVSGAQGGCGYESPVVRFGLKESSQPVWPNCLALVGQRPFLTLNSFSSSPVRENCHSSKLHSGPVSHSEFKFKEPDGIFILTIGRGENNICLY